MPGERGHKKSAAQWGGASGAGQVSSGGAFPGHDIMPMNLLRFIVGGPHVGPDRGALRLAAAVLDHDSNWAIVNDNWQTGHGAFSGMLKSGESTLSHRDFAPSMPWIVRSQVIELL